jgi:hypothetical protein
MCVLEGALSLKLELWERANLNKYILELQRIENVYE